MRKGVVLLQGSGDPAYPFILSRSGEYSDRLLLKKAEIQHNLPRISNLKVYEVLDCRLKLSRQGVLEVITTSRCELLGLKSSGRNFRIECIYLELKERKAPQ